MEPKFSLADVRIRTKLLLVNFLICSVFMLMSAFLFWSLRHAQGPIRKVVDHDIREVTSNALTERELFAVQADTGLLLNTFYHDPEHLKSEGARLLHLTGALVERNRGRDLEVPLGAFSHELARLLQQCHMASDTLRQLVVLERSVILLLDRLENTISEKLIDQTILGEDTGVIEQLASLAASYRTNFLEIGKLRAESWPQHYYTETEDDVVLMAVDELILRCRTLTASDFEVAQLGRELIRMLQDFHIANLDLHQAMAELATRKQALDDARKGVQETMAVLDRDVAPCHSRGGSQGRRPISGRGSYAVAVDRFSGGVSRAAHSPFFQKDVSHPHGSHSQWDRGPGARQPGHPYPSGPPGRMADHRKRLEHHGRKAVRLLCDLAVQGAYH